MPIFRQYDNECNGMVKWVSQQQFSIDGKYQQLGKRFLRRCCAGRYIGEDIVFFIDNTY